MIGGSFDTLKFARKLESGGVPANQAESTSMAMAEALAEWQGRLNLATRDDLLAVRNDLTATREELRLEISRLEVTTKAEFQRLEAQTGERFAQVNQRIAKKAVEAIKWLIGMSVAQAGLIIGILKISG